MILLLVPNQLCSFRVIIDSIMFCQSHKLLVRCKIILFANIYRCQGLYTIALARNSWIFWNWIGHDCCCIADTSHHYFAHRLLRFMRLADWLLLVMFGLMWTFVFNEVTCIVRKWQFMLITEAVWRWNSRICTAAVYTDCILVYMFSSLFVFVSICKPIDCRYRLQTDLTCVSGA